MAAGKTDRRKLMKTALPAAALAAVATRAEAQSAPGYEVPGLKLAFTAHVTISGLKVIGDTPYGQGRIAPITGGTFEGPRLRGKVMPGGADWQTVRADGVTELNAHYGLETDDGVIIQVNNHVIARPALGDQPRLLRSTIRLDAPKGPHDWVNKAVFVGTLNAPDAATAPVVIRCFEVV